MAQRFEQWRICLLFILGLLLSSARGLVAAEPPAKPNIVLILADDLGWKDVGYHGSQIRTPNIDKLARSGAKLEQYYVCPLCSPTRASLLTGRYPMRQGLQVSTVQPWMKSGLPLAERTLPQALKEAGYETWITGKWHLGISQGYLPLQRGFDHQYGCYNGHVDYFTHDHRGGLDWHRDQVTVREIGHCTNLIGAEAVRAIDTHDRTKPLFLYVPFNAPHAPHQAPEEEMAEYSMIKNETARARAAQVTGLDTQIGRIREALARNHMENDTLIMFFSDNGAGANGELRGSKGSLYDGGSRVPCCVHWPGRIPAGTTVSALITVRDWYPTLLRLAGASLKQPLPIDGKDVWPCLVEGAASPNRVHLYNTSPYSGAVRTAEWKLIRRKLGKTPASEAADPAYWPHSDDGPAIELFNMRTDPYEKNNVADANPAVVAELTRELEALAAQAVPPQFVRPPADFPIPKEW